MVVGLILLVQQLDDHLFSDAGRMVHATLPVRSDTDDVRPRERHILATLTLHNDALWEPMVEPLLFTPFPRRLISLETPHPRHGLMLDPRSGTPAYFSMWCNRLMREILRSIPLLIVPVYVPTPLGRRVITPLSRARSRSFRNHNSVLKQPAFLDNQHLMSKPSGPKRRGRGRFPGLFDSWR